ncbi:MAG: hypothetical protein NC043_04570 [Muribaculaceae bacterium]|nr:hypothetical protein [Muribaculaceae bacterium]
MRSIFITCICALTAIAVNAQTNVHYEGRVEGGYQLGTADRHKMDEWVISTTHGVSLFADRLFLGGGIGFGLTTNQDRFTFHTIPIYADIRYTLSSLKVRPYVDVKIGGAIFDDGGLDGGGYDGDFKFYIAPTAGISIPLSRLFSLNAAVGYTYQNAYYHYGITGFPMPPPEHFNAGGVTFSAGIAVRL